MKYWYIYIYLVCYYHLAYVYKMCVYIYIPQKNFLLAKWQYIAFNIYIYIYLSNVQIRYASQLYIYIYAAYVKKFLFILHNVKICKKNKMFFNQLLF